METKDFENYTKEELIEYINNQIHISEKQPKGLKERIDFNNNYSLEKTDKDEIKDGYQLKWIGKDYARLQSGMQTETVIIPDNKHNEKEGNKNSQNLFFTGDNLEVLRHLQNAYTNSIKMIYIDPPYNTGGEFVYNDKFEFSDKKLKEMLDLTDDEIQRLHTINGKSSHSSWLTFMYPRLKIAKSLLSNNGVMYISIDENEQANLKLLCDEIFADYNTEILIWRKNGKQGNTKKINRFKNTHEYILVAYKDKLNTRIGKVKLLPNWKGNKKNVDNDYRGNWESGVISRDEENSDKKSANYYSIQLPSGRTITREFYIPKEELSKLIDDNRIYFPKEGDGVPRLKIFENEEQNYYFDSIIDEMGTFTDAHNEIIEIFDGIDVFDTPKPMKILKELVRTTTTKSDTILDFFSGSSTTAHAVMQLNAEDKMDRKYIMVQLPEHTNVDSEAKKAGFNTIDEISRKRIQLSADKIKKETNAEIDYGFKHYYVKEADVQTINKIEEFDPNISKLIADNMVQEFDNEFSKGKDVIFATWLVSDGYKLNEKVEIIDFKGYKAQYIDNSLLYLIDMNWSSEQTKQLLNFIGENKLNINTIIVYGYSFTLESIKELEIAIKQNFDNRIKIEKRY